MEGLGYSPQKYIKKVEAQRGQYKKVRKKVRKKNRPGLRWPVGFYILRSCGLCRSVEVEKLKKSEAPGMP